nr:hypothetical protein B0A51_13005 [Rachicladosporium sp. CCFEE 5018]
MSLFENLANLSIVAPRSTKPNARPGLSRSGSSGWYDTTDAPTLEDFASQAQTWAKRIERYQQRCATNVVMALIGPTPVTLLVFNPLSLLLWLVVVLLVWWLR